MTIKMALILPLILIVWITLLAGVMALSGRAPAALVILPPAGFVADLPPGVAIVSQTRFSITLASTQPGITPALYRAGAYLVLPAGLRGCSIS